GDDDGLAWLGLSPAHDGVKGRPEGAGEDGCLGEPDVVGDCADGARLHRDVLRIPSVVVLAEKAGGLLLAHRLGPATARGTVAAAGVDHGHGRCPGASWVTPEPAASTQPLTWWPSVTGSWARGNAPA